MWGGCNQPGIIQPGCGGSSWAQILFSMCSFFFFWPCHVACRILTLGPGTESGRWPVKVLSPNHRTAKEFPTHTAFTTCNTKINSLQDELCQDLVDSIFPVFIVGGQLGGLARVGVDDQPLNFGQKRPNGKIPPDHVVHVLGPFSFNVFKELLDACSGRHLLKLFMDTGKDITQKATQT